MILFDLLNLRKDVRLLIDNKFLYDFRRFIQDEIIAHVSDKVRSGRQKRLLIISSGESLINKHVRGKNKLIADVLKLILPEVVQFLYDSLKEFVEDLTDKPKT